MCLSITKWLLHTCHTSQFLQKEVKHKKMEHALGYLMQKFCNRLTVPLCFFSPTELFPKRKKAL